jgi:hypothetical protein
VPCVVPLRCSFLPFQHNTTHTHATKGGDDYYYQFSLPFLVHHLLKKKKGREQSRLPWRAIEFVLVYESLHFQRESIFTYRTLNSHSFVCREREGNEEVRRSGGHNKEIDSTLNDEFVFVKVTVTSDCRV